MLSPTGLRSLEFDLRWGPFWFRSSAVEIPISAEPANQRVLMSAMSRLAAVPQSSLRIISIHLYFAPYAHTTMVSLIPQLQTLAHSEVPTLSNGQDDYVTWNNGQDDYVTWNNGHNNDIRNALAERLCREGWRGGLDISRQEEPWEIV